MFPLPPSAPGQVQVHGPIYGQMLILVMSSHKARIALVAGLSILGTT